MSIKHNTAWDFIEEGDDQTAALFYDFCWTHFRNQMRVMIVAFVDSDEWGRKAYEEWIESFDTPENRALVKADEQRDLKEDR